MGNKVTHEEILKLYINKNRDFLKFNRKDDLSGSVEVFEMYSENSEKKNQLFSFKKECSYWGYIKYLYNECQIDGGLGYLFYNHLIQIENEKLKENSNVMINSIKKLIND